MSHYCKRNCAAQSSSRIVGTYSGTFSYQIVAKNAPSQGKKKIAPEWAQVQSKRVITMTAGDAENAS